MANEVGGLLDNLLKVGFDYKKFLADARLRTGIEAIAGALKDATTSPLNLDDKIIDGMVSSLELFLTSLSTPASGGLVVKAPVPYTAVDAMNAVSALEASQSVTFSQEVKDKIKQHPEVMRLISKHSEHWQAKFLASDWLNTVIQWLQTYGPTLVQILVALLPLFI